MPARIVRRGGRGRRPAYKPALPRAQRHPRISRRGLLWVVLGALLLGLAYGGWWSYTSNWLTVQQLSVEGASAVSEDSIRDAAALMGQRLLLIDTAAAADRVKALAGVKDAVVQRHFPHGATIVVTERAPIGIWQVGANSYLVDEDGKVLDSGLKPGNLPVVDATRAGIDVQVGDRVDADALRVAQQVAALAAAVPGQSVARFLYDKQTGLTALTESGLQVHLGDGQNLDYKLAVWQALVRKGLPGDMHELDLRYGDRPYYR